MRQRYVCLCALCFALSTLAAAPAARASDAPAADKKLIRIGSELASQLLGSTSIADAGLAGKVPIWQQTGLDGMVFSIASDRSLYPGSTRNMTGLWWNVKDLQLRTYDEFIPDIQAFQSVADWGNLTDNFLWSSMAVWDTPSHVASQNWFNDDHWSVIANNVGIQARIAHEVGFKGVLLDTEQYDHHGGGAWYHPFNYDEYANGGYQLAGESQPRTLAEVSAQVYERGRQYAQALVAEFPDITLMTIPAFYRPNGLRPDEHLLAPFMDGIVAGLGEHSKLVVGTEYSYGVTDADEMMTIRNGAISQWLANSQNPQALLDKLSIAIGIQTDGINGGPFSDTDVTQNHRTPRQQQFAVYNALTLSDDYAWLYGETSYYTTTTPTALMQQYFQANVNAKKTPPPVGNILFDEAFTGGTFDEPGSALESSNGGVGSEIAFSGDALQITNYPDREGAYTATVAVDGASAYVIEQQVSIGAGAITENAMLLRAWDPAIAVNVVLVLEAKENGSGWDIEITHAAGVSMAGLSLERNEYHTLSVFHPGNGVVELYIDGQYVDNYFALAPGTDLGYIQIGNVSDSTGFSSATLSGLRIYEPIPEPASLIGYACCALVFVSRRRSVRGYRR